MNDFLYLTGLPPIVAGDGLQSRDFVHVTDVAAASVKAMFSNTRNGFSNVGMGKETIINGLASMMMRGYGLNGVVEHITDLAPDEI